VPVERAPAQHIPALDGLRGVAILLVVTHHFGTRAFWMRESSAEFALDRIVQAGWCGVDVFFVLSGYLITTILLRSRARPAYFRSFYVRRVLRIFPTYDGALAFWLLVGPALWPDLGALLGESRAQPGWLLTFTSNLALSAHAVGTFGVLDILWSVAIEEQFYVVWPSLVRIATPRALALVCAVLVVREWFLRLKGRVT
jgi:peptidoglycan/LPS O-acetylase OafA/YrhL